MKTKTQQMQGGGAVVSDPKQEWTKEPWRMERKSLFATNAYGMEENVGEVESFFHPYEAEANAARIVSCVNALANIPDPAEFVKAVEELTMAAKEILDAYISEMAAAYDYPNSMWLERKGNTNKEVIRLRAALARCGVKP